MRSYKQFQFAQVPSKLPELQMDTTICVACESRNTTYLSIIDSKKGALDTTINLPGPYHYDMIVSPDGAYLYVAHSIPLNSQTVVGRISKFDLNTETTVANFSAGVNLNSPFVSSGSIRKMLLSIEGGRLFILHRTSNSTPDTLSVLSTLDNSLITNIPLTNGVNNMSLSKNGSKIYVVSAGNTGANVTIDTDTYGVSQSNYGIGTNILVNSAGTKAYTSIVDATSSKVIVHNLQSGANNVILDKNYTVGFIGMEFTPDSSKLYVSFSGDQRNSVSVVDLINETEVGTVTVGNSPLEIISSNLAINALDCNSQIQTDSSNTFIATSTPHETVTDYHNTAIGFEAGLSLTNGRRNTFIGPEAGRSTTSGVGNTFMGYRSGRDNGSGDFNVGIGGFSLRKNRNGKYNIAVGPQAAYSVRDNERNISVGYKAGYNNNDGSDNTFIGIQAGDANTYGNYNIGLGNYSLLKNPGGSANISIGHLSMRDFDLGLGNVVIGHFAGRTMESGNQNVIIGYLAGNDISSSTGNVFIGANAGTDMSGSDQFVLSNRADSALALMVGDFISGNLILKGRFQANGGLRFLDGTQQLTSANQLIADSLALMKTQYSALEARVSQLESLLGNQGSSSASIKLLSQPSHKPSLDSELYPNPTSGELNVLLQDLIVGTSAEVKLVSIQGSTLKEWKFIPAQTTQQLELELSDIPTGTYQLRILNGSTSQVYSIVKK